jgi:hypothetical protein
MRRTLSAWNDLEKELRREDRLGFRVRLRMRFA